MRKLLILAILTCSALPLSAGAQKLVIDIQGVAQPTPVAIVPFGWNGDPSAAPMDVAGVVTEDLRRSGRFAPIDESQMLQKPTDGSGVDFDDWRVLGVEAVVVGTISDRDADNYTIRFQLFDSFRGRQLLGWSMNAPKNAMRGAAHRVADMVYEKLTGIKGVFGTRVAYVTAEERADGRWYSLFVADQDGENAHRIMESRDPIMSPAWSPDSRQLAYVSFKDNRSAIVVQNLRTGNWREVSNEPGINGAPSFSPDGRQPGGNPGRPRRQPGHLYAGPAQQTKTPPDDAPGNRYRRQLVTGWPLRLLHVGSQRRTAGLPGAGRWRRRGARDL